MEKKTTIKDLKLDPNNANKHSQYGTGLLENSIRENGFARSIVISKDNVIIAGNGTVEAAAAVGMENVRIVESDGNEIIAVRRTDIKSGTKEFAIAALADNIVAQKNIVMDVDVIEAIVEEFPAAKVWGSIITDPPGKRDKLEDPDAADKSTMTFHLRGSQVGKVKQAIKMSKELNKEMFQNAGNDNDNANAFYFICVEYLKAHKATKTPAKKKK